MNREEQENLICEAVGGSTQPDGVPYGGGVYVVIRDPEKGDFGNEIHVPLRHVPRVGEVVTFNHYPKTSGHAAITATVKAVVHDFYTANDLYRNQTTIVVEVTSE